METKFEIIRDSTPTDPIGRYVRIIEGERFTGSFVRLARGYEGLSAMLDAVKAVAHIPELDTEYGIAYGLRH